MDRGNAVKRVPVTGPLAFRPANSEFLFWRLGVAEALSRINTN
jgi:hypothetical protein